MAQSDTVERILQTATLLFAERGFAETSLRTITSMADVNLAAVNYHFGSKKALIQAVFSRFMGPFCVAIEKNLDSLDQSELSVGDIILAVGNAFVTMQKQVGEQPERIARLMNLAYTQSQEHLRQYCAQRYGKTLSRSTQLLQTASPTQDPVKFYWRLNFMLGASIFAISSLESLVAIIGQQSSDNPLDDVLSYLVPAMTDLAQSQS